MKNLSQMAIAIILVVLSITFYSCKKDTQPELYMRGGNSLLQASESSLLIAGYNTVASNGFDATLISTDMQGNVLKSNTYGGSYMDAFYSVCKGRNGGFVATGFSNSTSYNSPHMMIVLADATLGQTAMKTFGGSDESQGFSVIPSADSGYLVAGYILKPASDNRDIYLVRINNTGNTIWEKRYGAKSAKISDTINDEAYSIISAPDGGYFLTGSLQGYTSCCGKIFLMKIAANGDSLWTKTYDHGIGYSFTLTSDGGIAISGSVQQTSNSDIILIKTTLEGVKLWSKTFAMAGYDYGAKLVQSTDGGYAITGITTSKGAGGQDIYLLKTNALGEMQWDKTFGGSQDDQGFDLIQTTDGDYCITGTSNSDGSYIFLNKTSSDGTQIWVSKIK